MQNFDPVLETRILKTIVDHPEQDLYHLLSGDYFGSPVNQEIFGRLNNLKAAGKAFPSSKTLAGDQVLSENARTLLAGPLAPFAPHEVEFAFDQLEKFRKNRHYFWMVSKVADICKEQDPDHEKARQMVEHCLRLVQSPQGEKEILSYGGDSGGVLDLYEEILEQTVDEMYVPTGFRVIDKQQGGLGRGRLYTFGANSGGGKSTLANQIVINQYRAGFSVAYCSFEMGREECLLRTQANISRIPHDRFLLNNLTPDARKKSDQVLAEFLAQGEINGNRLDYICPTRDVNLNQLLSQLESLNYDVIVIDYINLMAKINPKEPDWWNIGEAFRVGKRFAERNRCVLLFVVQIDRDTGHIKYAQSIQHHSDGIWKWQMTDKEKELGVIEIHQEKLRNFAPTKFNLKPELEFCSFTESYGAGSPTAQPSPDVFKPMKL